MRNGTNGIRRRVTGQKRLTSQEESPVEVIVAATIVDVFGKAAAASR